MVQEGLHPQRARGQSETAGYPTSLSPSSAETGASCTGGKRGDLNHVAGYFPKLDSFLKVCGGCSCEGTGKGDSVGTVESKDRREIKTLMLFLMDLRQFIRSVTAPIGYSAHIQ